MTDNPLIADIITQKIRKKGGWVNCHAHFDRAYTVSPETLTLSHQLMEKKWTLVDDMKKHSSEEDYYARIERAVCVFIAQGAKATCTFIDVDPITELRALKAAVKVKKKYAHKIECKIINQVLKGVVDPAARKWAEKSLEFVDIIGGLPSRDRPDAGKHLDTIFSWAKETGKMVHVHIDQENNPHEHDTELLADKTIKYGLEGKVIAVHAISIAAHPKKERKEIYKKLKAAGICVVCCPSAALSMKQLDYSTALHNSIAPVPELLVEGIPVALGVDNMADIYQPLVDGDLITELRMLAESCRFYDIDKLVDIATMNGQIALGMR